VPPSLVRRPRVGDRQKSAAHPRCTGLGRRWLVNGAGDGILAIGFESRQRAYVTGFPVRLRQLPVSVEDLRALATALAAQG